MILHSIDPDGGFGAARQLEWLRAGGQEIDRSIIIDPTLGFRPWLNNGIYNEYGTLSSMYPVDKPLDKARILVLGSRAVIKGQLVETLRRSYPQHNTEIWNGGVDSYGAMQTINFYKRYQSKIQPDKVILFLTSNDIETTPIAPETLPNFILTTVLDNYYQCAHR